MTDHDIIDQLKSSTRNKAIKVLYKEFPKVRSYILKSGGSLQVAQEIFNDSLILLIEKVEAPSFQLTSKLSTFLVGIARFLWQNEIRRSRKLQEVKWESIENLETVDIAYDVEEENKIRVLENVLTQLAARCRDILQLFYFDGCSMKEIASRLNFSSENSAKTQKYKCLENAILLSVQLSENIEQ